ncbi:hypothetical protein CJ030_MR4G012556 [Morella rubra]|uniref:Uncharacterized protein n=1 Tax=Morella rubra TaxID=262757 RepID=A0A6A1VRL5_9ROSI|nr:hypothetical protein CJ030_MR4G012556 [Morella rubra]
MEGEDPGQSSTQGLGAQWPSWMDDMMTELSQQMESVLQPTHCMVSDISRRLTALEQKVTDMDVGWKKEVAALKEVLKGVAIVFKRMEVTESQTVEEKWKNKVNERFEHEEKRRADFGHPISLNRL